MWCQWLFIFGFGYVILDGIFVGCDDGSFGGFNYLKTNVISLVTKWGKCNENSYWNWTTFRWKKEEKICTKIEWNFGEKRRENLSKISFLEDIDGYIHLLRCTSRAKKKLIKKKTVAPDVQHNKRIYPQTLCWKITRNLKLEINNRLDLRFLWFFSIFPSVQQKMDKNYFIAGTEFDSFCKICSISHHISS